MSTKISLTYCGMPGDGATVKEAMRAAARHLASLTESTDGLESYLTAYDLSELAEQRDRNVKIKALIAQGHSPQAAVDIVLHAPHLS